MTCFFALTVFTTACKKEENKLPEVTTNDILYARRTLAALDGSVRPEVSDSIIAYGFCWNTTGLPTLSDNNIPAQFGPPQHFQAYPEGLKPNTTYYVRAYAKNLFGTSFGSEKMFTTMTATITVSYNPSLQYNSVMDIEGNVYKTIDIGTQTWMAENLRTTRYNDNSEIPLVSDKSAWEQLLTPGYCWYENNEEVYKNIFGALYNGYAVNTGKLCPSGWHVPSDNEWKTLEVYLGIPQEAIEGGSRGTNEGLKIKEAGTNNWFLKENINGTNESGFTGLPCGRRFGYDIDTGWGEGVVTYWWSSSGYPQYNWLFCRWLLLDHTEIFRDASQMDFGLSVRCIKDRV